MGQMVQSRYEFWLIFIELVQSTLRYNHFILLKLQGNQILYFYICVLKKLGAMII